MVTEFVKNLLRAVPEEKSWAVGEALAESVLADDDTREICWPWNLVRDRRTLKASLPGADLVGFCNEGDAVLLLFGEVKTSSDASTPPNVMNGSGGMAWQLKDEATHHNWAGDSGRPRVQHPESDDTKCPRHFRALQFHAISYGLFRSQ